MQFNLANLLAAMAIMAVMALVLVPFAADIGPALAVERGAEQLARELQETRQLAVAEKVTYDVIFDRTNRAYLIKEANMFAPARRIDLPPGVEWLHFPPERISFYGTGHCSIGGTIALYHRETTLQVRVVVAAQTGRVRVERGHR